MADTYLRIRNWDRFQHYKRGRGAPPWIRLYSALLDDPDYNALPDYVQLQIVQLFLLASRVDNRIPDDCAWIQKRLSCRAVVNVDVLVNSGFIERCDSASNVLAGCKQLAIPEQIRAEQSRAESPTDSSPTSLGMLGRLEDQDNATPADGSPHGNGAPKITAEEIYQAYPRKVEKQAALKAIRNALTSLRRRPGMTAPESWLLERTREFANARARAIALDPRQAQFTKHPPTWFNKGCYDDDPGQWEPEKRGNGVHKPSATKVQIHGEI